MNKDRDTDCRSIRGQKMLAVIRTDYLIMPVCLFVSTLGPFVVRFEVRYSLKFHFTTLCLLNNVRVLTYTLQAAVQHVSQYMM